MAGGRRERRLAEVELEGDMIPEGNQTAVVGRAKLLACWRYVTSSSKESVSSLGIEDPSEC